MFLNSLKRIFLIATLLVPVAMHCSEAKKNIEKQKPQASGLLQFYRNHKVICGTSLGVASGMFQAWLHSKYTPHRGEYAASAFAGGVAGAISGAADVIPEVFVAGNVGGALGVRHVNPPFTHPAGTISGVLVGGAAGLANNHKKHTAGVIGAGLGIACVANLRDVNVLRNPYIVVPTAAIVSGMAVTAARIGDIIGEPEEKIPNDAFDSAMENASWTKKDVSWHDRF